MATFVPQPCLLPPLAAAHAGAVAASLAGQLSSLRHRNGAPVCMLYGAHASMRSHPPPRAPPPQQQQQEATRRQPEQQQQQSGCEQGGREALAGVVGQGPVVAFNLLRPDGSFVGYR